MAQNTRITAPRGTVTQLSNANITTITFQLISGTACYIMATTNTTAPDAEDFGLLYKKGEGELNKTLADMFPGLTSPVRIWVWSPVETTLFVSHD